MEPTEDDNRTKNWEESPGFSSNHGASDVSKLSNEFNSMRLGYANAACLEDGNGRTEEDIDVIEAMRDVGTEGFGRFIRGRRMLSSSDSEQDDNCKSSSSTQTANRSKKQRKRCISRQLRRSVAMTLLEARQVLSIQELSLSSRWNLYKYWLGEFLKEKQLQCIRIAEKLRVAAEKLNEIKLEEDLFVLRKAEIVGMTTTGAAKYRDIVNGLGPRIVIVEEAAEVLESHIITSLSEYTQHLILIGDHQQLRPKTTVHELAVQYNLDVSLFERMVNNGVEYCQLELQHRMRPSISSLLVPHIYRVLRDSDSVHKYESILGVTKNMFFVSHSFFEDQIKNSTSKVNMHETSFIVNLCKYFLHQGYSGSQITILATYSGQMVAIKNKTKGKLFEDVRVTSVDSFQGEESDIVLISFVRSNKEQIIGFLKTSNRICVALSRAKKGLYCTGNFDLFASKSILWKNIISDLRRQEAIGTSLRLQCQNHPETFTDVSKRKDFALVPEGGCSKPCRFKLKCGHICGLKCHAYDPKHTDIRCMKPCTKKCSLGHTCRKKCFQKCEPCEVQVKKKIPSCGHVVLIPCHISSEEFECMAPCNAIYHCGHKCPYFCSEICAEECVECYDYTDQLYIRSGYIN